MVVEFSVKNFRSINELQTISFVATGLKSPDDFADVDAHNIVEDGGIRLLKTVGIYGANASGKSNIIRALEYFLQAIRNEASSESNLAHLCDPYLYHEGDIDTESFFQIVFILAGKKYRYGFTVKKNPNYPGKNPAEKVSKEIIVNEWLFGTKEKNSGEYFIRNGVKLSKDKMPDSELIPPIQYEHTLFLTHAAAFDILGICNSIRYYLSAETVSNFEGFESIRETTIFFIDHYRVQLLALLSAFNLQYEDIIIDREINQKNSLAITNEKIFFKRKFKNGSNKFVKLNLGYNESSGTQKLFDIAGILLRAFNFGKAMLIILDEIDSNFHPSLLIKLIGLFNDPLINKSNSQLLFTSHDTNLMSPSIMRRDQFYFTEKSEDDCSTRLYSLADLKGIRNDADFSRDYLRGFYGAVPTLSDFIHPVNLSDGATLGD